VLCKHFLGQFLYCSMGYVLG